MHVIQERQTIKPIEFIGKIRAYFSKQKYNPSEIAKHLDGYLIIPKPKFNIGQEVVDTETNDSAFDVAWRTWSPETEQWYYVSDEIDAREYSENELEYFNGW